MFEVYPDFRLCEILLASFVTALLLPEEGEVVENCFWTSYNKLCQVSSSSIHTLKLYQRATQVEVIYEQQIKQQQQEEQQQCQIFVFTRLIKTKNIVSLHLVSGGVQINLNLFLYIGVW